jgi:hypothetical protein
MGNMETKAVYTQRTTENHPAPGAKPTPAPVGFEAQLQRQMEKEGINTSPFSKGPPGREAGSQGLIHIGTISRENPTVSHLLITHRDYRRDCWDIIHSDVNDQKAFCRVQEGEKIFIDPITREITWGGRSPTPSTAPPPQPVASSGSQSPQRDAPVFKGRPSPRESGQTATRAGILDSTSTSLATVLKQRIGTPYHRLDCYELVVAGLRDMGVRYAGSGGMQRYLINAAASQGLPMNAYLTGEGLIQASATTVYDRTLTAVSQTEKATEALWKEIEPCLEKGLIVSFSTGGRGHTGVVSTYDRTWTFLNSGDIDNDVRSTVRRKGVGEEELRAEIANWVRRAARNGKSLRIAMGRLNPDKLAAFNNTSSPGRTA